MHTCVVDASLSYTLKNIDASAVAPLEDAYEN